MNSVRLPFKSRDLSVNQTCKSTWQHCPLGSSYRKSIPVEMLITCLYLLSSARHCYCCGCCLQRGNIRAPRVPKQAGHKTRNVPVPVSSPFPLSIIPLPPPQLSVPKGTIPSFSCRGAIFPCLSPAYDHSAKRRLTSISGLRVLRARARRRWPSAWVSCSRNWVSFRRTKWSLARPRTFRQGENSLLVCVLFFVPINKVAFCWSKLSTPPRPPKK